MAYRTAMNRQRSELQQKISQLFDKPFLIICLFYFASFWFFSFWVMRNQGVYWDGPLGIPHHPFNMKLLDTDFIQTITYLFVQSPFYSVFTWLMLKTDTNNGFLGYLILHYIMGFFALISLYKILSYLNINRWLIAISLSYFVFNPGFYRAFTSGWYDFLSMCLVSITTYYFMRLVVRFTNTNLIYFFLAMTILILYRNIFSPLLFFVPMIIWLMLSYRDKWRRILWFSLLPFAITLTPYVKNYLIFNVFDVGPGQFATAIKSTTYQYQPYDLIVKDIDSGLLSPLVLCYNFYSPTTYRGIVYSLKTCQESIFSQFAVDGVNKILKEKPYLKNPAILQVENNLPSGADYISNSLLGFVIAKQLTKDAKNFIIHHPIEYLWAIQNNLIQLFRSNNEYEYNIAGNARHYPEWFRTSFNVGLIKLNTRYDPILLLGMLCSLTYGFLYASYSKRSNFFSLIHIAGMLLVLLILRQVHFLHLYSNLFLNISLCWSLLFIIPSLFIALKSGLSLPILKDGPVNMRLMITFMVIVCVYFLAIIDLIPGSEQERYRFTVEGLLIGLFLFWITNLYSYIKKILPIHN